MMTEHSLAISPDGTITLIYSDDLAVLLDVGRAIVLRASHVEPHPQGGWIADMSPITGPVLGPFPLRQQALEAEAVYLKARLFDVLTRKEISP